MKNRRSFICVLVILSFHMLSQPLPVSLLKQIDGKPPEVKVRILDSLSGIVRKSSTEESLILDRLNITISRQNGLHWQLAKAFITISKTYRVRASYDTALFFCDSAIYVAKMHVLKAEIASALDLKGIIYTRIGNYDKAMKSFQESLLYTTQTKDSSLQIGVYNHIGNLFFYQKDYSKAKIYYQKSLSYISVEQQPQQYATAIDNIGLCFLNMMMYDSALFYQKQGVSILESLNKPLSLAESYNNISATYLQLNRFTEAETTLRKALTIAETIEDDYTYVNASITLGEMYLKQHLVGKAASALESAYRKAKSRKFLHQSKDAALSLARIYAELKQYQKSTVYFEDAAVLSDSLYTSENNKISNELSVKYETREKLQKIELLTKDNEIVAQKARQNRYLTYFISLLALLLLVMGLFFFNRFRQKKKDHAILLLKNKDIAHKKELIEFQKEELFRKNKEITDSINYAQLIQKSALPSTGLLKQFLGQSFIYYKPKDIVSGDFYWMSRQAPYIYIAVADCTGHGVPGAIVSMLGMSGLNQIISEKPDALPSDILLQMHRQVLHTLHEDVDKRALQDGMDIAIIRIDAEKKEFMYAGAGRPLYCLRESGLQVISPDKFSIGSVIAKDIWFTDHSFSFEQGCKVFLFTDGVTDQFGGSDGKKFKTAQLKQFLAGHSKSSISEIEEDFIHLFENWGNSYEQTDDVTVFGVYLS